MIKKKKRNKSISLKVRSKISQHCGLPTEKIGCETELDGIGGWDSLDQVECILHLEDEFDIEISDEEAKALKTVGEVVDFIEKKLDG